MSLPIVTLENHEKWDCHQCGYCCRSSLIPLQRNDLDRLADQRWDQHPDFREIRIMVPYRTANSSYRLAHRADGTCVFLTPAGRCRIHEQFGAAAKPTVCQVFPLQLIPRDRTAVLTVRRACPSAAADRGPDISTQLRFVKQLVRDSRIQADAIAPPLLKHGEYRDWKTISCVLDSAVQLLQDARFPTVRRIVHLLQFAGYFSAAKTRPLSDTQIAELAHTLAELVPEESQPLFADRRPPKKYSKILFRTVAVNCARLHPQCRYTSTWRARLELVRTAWQTLSGVGESPRIGDFFPAVRFSDLEAAHGAMRPEIYHPLTRYFETTAASYLFATADRQAWPVIDSLRGLAILFPVGLWLLRWVARGRDPTVDDMLHIVVALDRSQGYQPLTGLLHRRRLTAIAAGEELERLAIWYAS